MILKTNEMMVDVDRIAAILDQKDGSALVCFDGAMVVKNEQKEVIEKAFKKLHYTHTYDENLKIVKDK